jgi:hypothetical protein
MRQQRRQPKRACRAARPVTEQLWYGRGPVPEGKPSNGATHGQSTIYPFYMNNMGILPIQGESQSSPQIVRDGHTNLVNDHYSCP